MPRPTIAVARAIFPEVIERLQAHFEVRANPQDQLLNPQELVAFLQGCDGLLCTGSERIDAAVLAACPQLRICANMAVGYNNFDLDAMTAARVLGTNTPC
jgi:gluconate 2-dehydrogenase